MIKKTVLMAAVLSPMTVAANDAYLSVGVSQAVYETADTSGGRATSLNFAFTSENRSGFWFGVSGEASIDANSSPGGSENSIINAEYRMGKYWYPRASASDFSLWGGLGYWKLDDAIGNAGNQNRTAKALYVPLGVESGMPVAQGSMYFVYGGSLMLIVDGSVQSASQDESERGGLGLTGWAGFDFRYSNKTLIETRFIAQRVKIDGNSELEFVKNSMSLSVRF